MSHPIQQYKSDNDSLVDQQLEKSLFDSDHDDDIFRSFFGLANRMMSETLRSGPNINGVSTFMSSDSNNPKVKVFGLSSMNVTQISRGPDGRPRVIQAHDERRMGPGGVWQTKKALRDPDHGIDRMQVGYFVGDRGEIVERHLDPNNGQYRQEIKRRGIPSNEQNFSNNWRIQAQQAMQRPQPLPTQSHQQQQLPLHYEQYPQQTLPSPPSYQYY
ncbi:unnamed protein product [Rotaria magnacalcarata]|uniref:Uncharacterized protein n=4 Tax=Rotaria magnacalcarata TaxID=392030 RepID=A0A816A4L6_9BILA|nr:unnamed protein product [Rotaria magnacalcarata]CAF1598722.1 unnamed protein product [Rotaria magnacalcarata]CAF2033006.1 unnamed protein product [Rotaria magnacalcarata]CAF2066154.1 unnamed protein product [Rotaria magnacalcarata]CAF2137422.1 unnamed protein product [Rotaria magnacalcarata]